MLGRSDVMTGDVGGGSVGGSKVPLRLREAASNVLPRHGEAKRRAKE